MRASIPKFLAVFALAGCHDATDPEIQRVIGRIDPSATGRPVIVAPDEVPAGARFTVVVHTLGSPNCTTPDGESVTVVGDVIRIVPYDIVPIPGHSDVCLGSLASHEHLVPLVAAEAGTLRIRAVGYGASFRANVLDSGEVSITIQP